MKLRRVIVAIELDTPAPLKELREHSLWDDAIIGKWFDADTIIHQVQANVVKQEKGGKA